MLARRQRYPYSTSNPVQHVPGQRTYATGVGKVEEEKKKGEGREKKIKKEEASTWQEDKDISRPWKVCNLSASQPAEWNETP